MEYTSWYSPYRACLSFDMCRPDHGETETHPEKTFLSRKAPAIWGPPFLDPWWQAVPRLHMVPWPDEAAWFGRMANPCVDVVLLIIHQSCSWACSCTATPTVHTHQSQTYVVKITPRYGVKTGCRSTVEQPVAIPRTLDDSTIILSVTKNNYYCSLHWHNDNHEQLTTPPAATATVRMYKKNSNNKSKSKHDHYHYD